MHIVGPGRRRLLGPAELDASSVVANNAMNRGRRLRGYSRELGLNLTATLSGKTWLDLCCGEGHALAEGVIAGADVTGVDLVGHFAVPPAANLRLVVASIPGWQPERDYDLVTVVHGLHYLGDKLRVLTDIAGWLTEHGRFVANFDIASVEAGSPRKLLAALRSQGFGYDPRNRRISRTGPAVVELPYEYLGADDTAGPNYTGQPAVVSHYRA
ncbi:methyltransferase domain-containing protein [Herbidospora sp. NEAU-GS84]|uniref:Methyltransferase domain-containing protein n=1 Tax=Herbidospora solisilvae TaxID=2696284 RepID=A0A7C9J509_9ACTN|nr:methyltransferase domain-containing protein [Herbidospora solisilvae]NAS24902.1 methyltransferase domain-containing protein [Herbidospora solisilvae]